MIYFSSLAIYFIYDTIEHNDGWHLLLDACWLIWRYETINKRRGTIHCTVRTTRALWLTTENISITSHSSSIPILNARWNTHGKSHCRTMYLICRITTVKYCHTTVFSFSIKNTPHMHLIQETHQEMRDPNMTSLYFATPLAFNAPNGGVPLGHLRKI